VLTDVLSDRVCAKWKKIERDLVAVMAVEFNSVRDVETGGMWSILNFILCSRGQIVACAALFDVLVTNFSTHQFIILVI